jgi:hypothetical protein
MGSWHYAGRILRDLRESRGWEVPRLAAELKAQAAVVGHPVPDRPSLVRMIYEWEAGTHRPRAYYVLFILVYATEEELAARTIEHRSELTASWQPLRRWECRWTGDGFSSTRRPLRAAWPVCRRSPR